MDKEIDKEIKRVISEFQNRYGDNMTINSNGIMTKQDERDYNQKNSCRNAFELSVNDIISAIHVIPLMYASHKTKTSNSYSMKHKIEKNKHYIELKGHSYLANGNLIVAMLIMGYKYRYERGNGATPNPNVDFYVITPDRYAQKKKQMQLKQRLLNDYKDTVSKYNTLTGSILKA